MVSKITKKSIVPKSPIEEPITHHIVFLGLLPHVSSQLQLKVSAIINIIFFGIKLLVNKEGFQRTTILLIFR
jgi:hypothetical protein|tara:strand:- start:188 stop:403 length:216 start_codon:yes stop_codon:yes gene_type:complete